jgi:hypothetical protein
MNAVAMTEAEAPVSTTPAPGNDDTLNLDQIRYWLATGRQALAVIDDELGQRRQALAEQIQEITQKWTEANSELLSTYESQRETVDGWEIKAREAIIRNFHATGNKKPCDGFGVRVTKRFLYEPERAFDFAKEKGMFLTLNRKEFDDFCKTSSKPSWVEVDEIPVAQISPDLKG